MGRVFHYSAQDLSCKTFDNWPDWDQHSGHSWHSMDQSNSRSWKLAMATEKSPHQFKNSPLHSRPFAHMFHRRADLSTCLTCSTARVLNTMKKKIAPLLREEGLSPFLPLATYVLTILLSILHLAFFLNTPIDLSRSGPLLLVEDMYSVTCLEYFYSVIRRWYDMPATGTVTG